MSGHRGRLQFGPASPRLGAGRRLDRGAVAKGITDNQRKRTETGKDGLRLARRFRDHEDMTAPRGALLYSRFSREEFGGYSWV